MRRSVSTSSLSSSRVSLARASTAFSPYSTRPPGTKQKQAGRFVELKIGNAGRGAPPSLGAVGPIRVDPPFAWMLEKAVSSIPVRLLRRSVGR